MKKVLVAIAMMAVLLLTSVSGYVQLDGSIDRVCEPKDINDKEGFEQFRTMKIDGYKELVFGSMEDNLLSYDYGDEVKFRYGWTYDIHDGGTSISMVGTYFNIWLPVNSPTMTVVEAIEDDCARWFRASTRTMTTPVVKQTAEGWSFKYIRDGEKVFICDSQGDLFYISKIENLENNWEKMFISCPGGVPPSELPKADYNGDGCISYPEYLQSELKWKRGEISINEHFEVIEDFKSAENEAICGYPFSECVDQKVMNIATNLWNPGYIDMETLMLVTSKFKSQENCDIPPVITTCDDGTPIGECSYRLRRCIAGDAGPEYKFDWGCYRYSSWYRNR